MRTQTAQIKQKLEVEAGAVFTKKPDNVGIDRWHAEIDGQLIAKSSSLGDCIRIAARELGE